MTDPDAIKISYDLREVLDRMQGDQVRGFERVHAENARGFERLERGLAQKADKTDIERLERGLEDLRVEVGDHGERLGEIEGAKHEDELLSTAHVEHQQRSVSRRQKMIRAAWIVATTIALIAATAGWLH